MVISRMIKLNEEYGLISSTFSLNYQDLQDGRAKLEFSEKTEKPDHNVVSRWVNLDVKITSFYDDYNKTLYITMEGDRETVVASLLREILAFSSAKLNDIDYKYLINSIKSVNVIT
jgi:hypothetical protein